MASTSPTKSRMRSASVVTSSAGLAGASVIATIPVGTRVMLSHRRCGIVQYVGKLKNAGGEWYGVALDEASGVCDGIFEKTRYFSCPVKHGVFVRRKEIYNVIEPPEDCEDDSALKAESQEQSASPVRRTFRSFRRDLQPSELPKESKAITQPLPSPTKVPTSPRKGTSMSSTNDGRSTAGNQLVPQIPQPKTYVVDSYSSPKKVLRRSSVSETPSTIVPSASSRIQELELELESTQKNYSKAMQTLRTLNTKYNTDIEELRGQVGALMDGNTWLETQIHTKSALVANLKQSLAEDKQSYQRQLEVKDKQIKALEEKLETSQLALEKKEDIVQVIKVPVLVPHIQVVEKEDHNINKLRGELQALSEDRLELRNDLIELSMLL